MIEISQLKLDFDEKCILKNINVEVREGEMFCLLGPNGCGKTTLLKCIAGIHRHYGGHIHLNGKDIEKMNHRERAKILSYVPQMSKASFSYTVEEIVLMGRTPHVGIMSSPGKQDLAKVDQVLKEMNIGYLKHRRFNTLSGGEIQLVKLARGLAQQASIHILDEPTAALDLKNEMHLLQMIKSRIMNYGDTIIMATHYPNQALYFENCGLNVRVCLMKEGMIQYKGKPSDVINRENLKEIYDVETLILDYDMPKGERGYVVVPHEA